MLFLTSILLLATTAVNSQRGGVDYRREYYDETPKPYHFSFNEVLEDGGQISRTETSDANGRVQGSYSLTNDEGHTRIVDYVSDENGFRAHVRTNEPGTDNQNPADVVIESSSPYANRVNYQAGNVGRPLARRPTGLAGPEPVGPEVVPIDAIPDNVIPPRRQVGGRRPYRPAGRNPFGRV